MLYHTGERPWGHSVPSLLDQLCFALQIDPQSAPQAEAQALDEHYTRSRYPDARTEVELEYDEETAVAALEDAQTVLDFVRKAAVNVRADPDD
ncbi:MAG: hypothetical protein DCC55_31030 [Chloroflexi bacterium]|nr:MAG: hypothetical protein DCC55_31030 [Chloroflexota bacterium]